MLKEFREKFSPSFLAAVILVGLFITGYAEYVKKNYIRQYKKKIAVVMEDLDDAKKKAAAEKIHELEQGKITRNEEHDTQDFMHTSYFGEPWRQWESTVIVWRMVKNAYWVFVLLMFLYVPVSRIHHFLYLYISRKKLAKAMPSGNKAIERKAPVKPQSPEEKTVPAALRPFNIEFAVNPKVTAVLLIILFALMVNLSLAISKERSRLFPVNLDRPVGVQLFSELIGESRTILASYIYIRADMYHHERQERIRWDKDPATLPLYRVITALDPKFEQAYDFGAWHLAKNFNKHNEAIAFLQEGLRYSPESYQLRFTMGDIYYFKEDFEAAAKYYQQALEKAEDSVSVRNTLRRIYWCRRKLKQYDRALESLKMLYNMDPTDPVLPVHAKEIQDLASGRVTEEEFEKQKEKLRDEEKKNRMIRQLEEEYHHGGHKHHHHDHNH